LSKQQVSNKDRESVILQNSQAPINEKCELCVAYNPKQKVRIFHKVGAKILHLYRDHKEDKHRMEFVLRLQQIALDYQKQIRKVQS